MFKAFLNRILLPVPIVSQSRQVQPSSVLKEPQTTLVEQANLKASFTLTSEPIPSFEIKDESEI